MDPTDSSYFDALPRHLLRPRFWPTWAGLALLRCLSWLPRRARHGLARWSGTLAYRRRHKRRGIVLTNLRWCFPELTEAEREAMALGFFRRMMQSMLDIGVLWWGSDRRLDRLVALEGEGHLRPHREAGRPIILLAVHTVGIDFGGTEYSRRYPAATVYRPAKNELVDWWICHGRRRGRGLLYRRDQGLRPVVRAVRSGHALYYLPDEDLGPEQSMFAPFFGIPAATVTALPGLARLCNAVVVPFTTVYEPARGQYVVHIFPALEDYPSGDDQADVVRMNAEIERLIRLAPDQYMWSLRLFKTRPGGEKGPY